LVQSFFNEVDDIEQGWIVLTPTASGQILMRGDDSFVLDVEMHKRYQSGIGKLQYLAKNIHDLAMQASNKGHWKAMEHCIWYA
jgi:hypothetical protein